MKYTNRLLSIFSVVALLALGSCSEDFLDQEPVSSIETGKVFETIDGANAALIGAYDDFSSYAFSGLYLPLMSDLTGEDIMLHPTANYNWFVVVYQMDLLSTYSYPYEPWAAGYKIIYDANSIIKNIDKVQDGSIEEKASIVAQAKVMRAYSYLELIQMYAPAYREDPNGPGVILRTEPVEAYSDEDLGRSTIQEVYDQIILDLTDAEEDLTNAYSTGFFTQRAAQALLARTYLNMEDWENARDYAQKAREGKNLASIDELLATTFAVELTETIFKVAYTRDDNNIYLSLPSFFWPVGGYSSVRADDEFVQMFDENTDYRSLFFLHESEISGMSTSDFYTILKFGHNAQIGNAELTKIRVSEMYLIEAEAEYELGNESEALDAVNEIYLRANLGVSAPSHTGTDLLDFILEERRRELFGEGFRMNDIKRRGLPLVRTETSSHWVKKDIQPASAEYFRMTFPIPQNELDANKAMSLEDQNAGY